MSHPTTPEADRAWLAAPGRNGVDRVTVDGAANDGGGHVEVFAHATMARAGRLGRVGMHVRNDGPFPWVDMSPHDAEATALALLLSAAEARAATGDYR